MCAINIETLPENIYGVYSFWSGRLCLYVGMTSSQGLRRRLSQHYYNCRNNELKLWIDSALPVYFKYIEIKHKFYIKKFETDAIKKLAPLTNKAELKKYKKHRR